MRVPSPGRLSVTSVPPADSTRSRTLEQAGAGRRHGRVEAEAVVLDDEAQRAVASVDERPVIELAPECLAAFCTASRQQKYAAASTPAAYRPTPTARTSTGIMLVPTAAVRAASSPSAAEGRRVDPPGERHQHLDRLGGRPLLGQQRLGPLAGAQRQGLARGAGSPPGRRGAAGRRRGCRARASGAPRPGRRPGVAVRCAAPRRASTARRAAGSSSALSRAPRSTGPAWAGEPGEQAFLDRRERPVLALLDHQHPEQLAGRRRTGSDRCARPWSSVPSVRPGGLAAPVAVSAPGGQVAASCGRPPTTSHTWAHSAPVPSASTRAIRDGQLLGGVAAGHGLGERPAARRTARAGRRAPVATPPRSSGTGPGRTRAPPRPSRAPRGPRRATRCARSGRRRRGPARRRRGRRRP